MKRRIESIAWHLTGLLAIIGVSALVYFNQPWLLPRLWASVSVGISRGRAVIDSLLGNDLRGVYMLPEIYRMPYAVAGIPSFDLEAFKGDLAIWGSLLIDKSWALVSLLYAALATSRAFQWLMYALFFVPIGYAYLLLTLSEGEGDWRRKSLPYRLAERFVDGPWKSMRAYMARYLLWLRGSPWPWAVGFVLAFSLGLPMAFLELVGNYFYFFYAFDPIALADGALAIALTLAQGSLFYPWPMRLLAAYLAFRWLTVWMAGRLIEGRLIPANEEMVSKDTGVFTLILGKMRGGKTTLATAMARVLNTVYHKNALDNMNRVEMMFPDFPWAAFEKDIARLGARRRIVNMDQAAAFAYRLYEKGRDKPIILYGYDLRERRAEFYDGACQIHLDDAMAIYAESYWIYFQPGNLIASNYPIRTDDLRLDKGHLVLWDSDYFRRDNRRGMWEKSSLSRILVFDMLRLGKKVDEKSKYRDCNGPMVAVATEFGKEYGNMVTNQAYSAQGEAANPKNDMMDYSMKLGGHLANIWHTNFFKFIADEQRSGSLSSNLVDVAQSIFTADPNNQKEKTALRVMWVETMALDLLLALRGFYCNKCRHEREDRTLTYAIINHIGSWAYKMETRLYMRYGYKKVDLPRATCDSSGNITEGEKARFYILNYVDYSERFESACMKDFLNSKKSDAMRGFFDIPAYKGLMPTKEEWQQQGSYLVMDLEHPERKYGPQKGRAKPRRAGRAPDGAEASSAGRRGGRR